MKKYKKKLSKNSQENWGNVTRITQSNMALTSFEWQRCNMHVELFLPGNKKKCKLVLKYIYLEIYTPTIYRSLITTLSKNNHQSNRGKILTSYNIYVQTNCNWYDKSGFAQSRRGFEVTYCKCDQGIGELGIPNLCLLIY